MRLVIEAESQEEFELKRSELIKKIAGSKFEVILKSKVPSVYDKQKPAIAERKSYFKAQDQMLEYWDKKFKKMIDEIKKDVEDVLGS